jgi:hypothetical protein
VSRTIHFSCVVGGSDAPLLSRLVRHYRYLGVNGRWLIGVHMAEPGDPILERVEAILGEHDIDVAVTVVGPWLHRLNHGVLQPLRSLYPNDWAVIADQDEFQVYPDSLDAVVDFCERNRYEAVTGAFLDRIGEGGTLPPIEPGRSLWTTFPLGGEVSRVVVEDPEGKVTLARGDVVVGWGNHAVFRGEACPRGRLSVPVHHFKWDASVLERLRARYELYTRLGEPYAEESLNALERIGATGRIDVDDPRLRVRWIGNPYGDENALD